MPMFLLAMCLLWGCAGATPQQPSKDEQSDEYSVELVSNLMRSPVQMATGFGEKNVNRLGDKVSIALLKVLGEDGIKDPQNVERYLPLIHSAFQYPSLIASASDKKPKVTMFVLRQVANDTADRVLKQKILETLRFVRTQSANRK